VVADPTGHAAGSAMRLVTVRPWRWPWPFSFSERMEFSPADDQSR
jgi:hypothetical protein